MAVMQNTSLNRKRYLPSGFSIGTANTNGITFTNAALRFYAVTNSTPYYSEYDLLGSIDITSRPTPTRPAEGV